MAKDPKERDNMRTDEEQQDNDIGRLRDRRLKLLLKRVLHRTQSRGKSNSVLGGGHRKRREVNKREVQRILACQGAARILQSLAGRRRHR